jgi:hypothetical protein
VALTERAESVNMETNVMRNPGLFLFDGFYMNKKRTKPAVELYRRRLELSTQRPLLLSANSPTAGVCAQAGRGGGRGGRGGWV